MHTENNYKISFVVPSYNCEKTLEEAIDSIFNQNFSEGDEVILVNDSSTDKTLEIANALANKYPFKITILSNTQNMGCPATRNIGIRATKNDLIFNLDSDNILPRGSIELLRSALIKENADIVSFSEYHYFTEDTSKITHKWVCKNGLLTLEDLFSGLINPAPGGNFLYKKSLWEKVGGYWEYGKGLHEAWGFGFKLLLNNAVFFSVPHTFYFHRYSHDSLFIMENKKNNEGIKVTGQFIQNSFNIFDDKSIEYIQKNPNWFNDLEKHPLKLKSSRKGVNGKILFTSKIKQVIYTVRKFLKIC